MKSLAVTYGQLIGQAYEHLAALKQHQAYQKTSRDALHLAAVVLQDPDRNLPVYFAMSVVVEMKRVEDLLDTWADVLHKAVRREALEEQRLALILHDLTHFSEDEDICHRLVGHQIKFGPFGEYTSMGEILPAYLVTHSINQRNLLYCANQNCHTCYVSEHEAAIEHDFFHCPDCATRLQRVDTPDDPAPA